VGLIKGAHQAPNVVLPHRRPQLDGVVPRERREIERQLARLRHRRTAHQDGDDARAGLQRGGKLEAHEVVGLM
jgi:hypothetical protein